MTTPASAAPAGLPTEALAKDGRQIGGTGITRYHIVLFVICLLANVFGGTVSTLMSTYLPVAVKELVGGVDEEKFNVVSAYINAFFIFGWAFGGMLWGVVGDRIGRAKAIALSTGFYGLFTLLTGLTDSWTIVLLCRFLSGFGVGGVLVTTPTILSEVWPGRSRAIAIGILSIGIPVGIFSAGAIDLFVANWHQAFYVGLLPIVLSVFAAWKLQESEQWISRKTQNAGGEKPGTDIMAAHLGDLLLGSLIFGTMLVGLWAIFSWLPTWVHLNVSTMPGGSEETVGYSMMLFGAAGLSGGFFSGWLSNAIGPRKAMILCFAASLLLSFLLFKTTAGITVVFVEIGFMAFFFGASQGVLSAYIPELFPSSIRATATGLCFNIGRLATGTAVFFVGYLVTLLGGYGNAIFIFSLVFIVGLVSTWFSREVNKNPII